MRGRKGKGKGKR